MLFSHADDGPLDVISLFRWFSSLWFFIEERILIIWCLELFPELTDNSSKTTISIPKLLSYLFGRKTIYEVSSKGFILFLSRGMGSGKVNFRRHGIRIISTV